MIKNPIFSEFNTIIEFGKVTSQHLEDAVTKAIETATKSLEKIKQLPKNERTFQNTMQAYDALGHQLGKVGGCVFLVASVSPDEKIRQTGLEAYQKLGLFSNKLALDEDLYEAVKVFSQTEEAKNLTGVYEKLVRETVRSFEKNGFALPAEKRLELQKIQDELTELGNIFYKNINDSQDFLEVSEAEIQGLPEDFKKAHRTENNTYKISTDYPSYRPFMQFSKSESARKKLYIKFLNKASDTNLEVLRKILTLRHKKANLLGFNTFAEYQTDDLMTKNAQTVWDFEEDLYQKVRPKAEADYTELLEIKKQKTDPDAQEIHSWESSFYAEILRKEKYSIDSEEVKQYFELNAVLEGMFRITETLFGVKIQEVENPSVWHKEARLFEVVENQEITGRFYLDLFPREGKYGHAACFPMISGRQTEQGYQKPLLSLVCNFPRPTDEKPSLLKHSDVETMFHEFGHGLHELLTTSSLASYAGTSTVRDFVEVPSQLFENWTWNYETLQDFAKHYDTGEVLPKSLFDKMLAAKNVGSGLFHTQQIFYGRYDLTLHDRFDPEGEETTTDILRKLQNETTLYKYLEGTHFEAGFGHLNGYAASYYGYLWALVYAQDIFSVFEEQGILNPKIGKKYRETLLSQGGSIDENEQLKNFLEREPKANAFLKSLGV